ncbi:unnamed protein product, partial [Larinioides sclopetarius]
MTLLPSGSAYMGLMIYNSLSEIRLRVIMLLKELGKESEHGGNRRPSLAQTIAMLIRSNNETKQEAEEFPRKKETSEKKKKNCIMLNSESEIHKI